jgi:cytosine/adenosine deaminase-related metal-dependent hydrolase
VILRSRILLPISQSPIENGAVVIQDQRLAAVTRWDDSLRSAAHPVVDLGEAILLPGLVNAHCHLDYTDMAGQILPTRSFTDFIRSILAIKSTWTVEDFRRSWLRGADMLLRSGVTTVADVEAIPSLLPQVQSQTPLRLFSYLELIGLRNEPSPADMIRQCLEPVKDLSLPNGIGLSPHAPYSTTPELMRCSAAMAHQRQWRLTTHVAESDQEFDMFMHARGAMYDWLKSQRNTKDCGHGSPVEYLERLGVLGDNLVAIHVNYLWGDDAVALGRRQVSVVHCPRSHAFFQHQAFPESALSSAGVNIGLGTDSLATVKQNRGQTAALSLFAELQALATNNTTLEPKVLIRMATMNGARALGLSGQVGELTPHAWADLIAVPYAGTVDGVYDAVVHHTGDVMASMIYGRWAIAPAFARNADTPVRGRSTLGRE